MRRKGVRKYYRSLSIEEAILTRLKDFACENQLSLSASIHVLLLESSKNQ